MLLDAPVEARVEAGSLALTNVGRGERVAYRDVEAIENRVYLRGTTLALAIAGTVLLSGAMATALGVAIFEAGLARPTGCWCW